jgi:hypothetical protein
MLQIKFNLSILRCDRLAALLCRFKLIKYGKGTKRLVQLSLTVESAGPEIFNFAIIFAICATGFSFSAVILFSDELNDYGTFLGAIGCLMNAIFGNFNSLELYNANRVVGVAFIYLWLMLANTLLLNFCIAILSHHYTNSVSSRIPTRAGLQETSLSLSREDNIAEILDMKGVKLEPHDKYQVEGLDDGFGLAEMPRRTAWEDAEARPTESNHWQLLQMLEDVKLSISKLSEAHRATAAKVDMIWERLEPMTAGKLDGPTHQALPGEVGDSVAAWESDDEGDAPGKRPKDIGSRSQGTAVNEHGLTRSRAKIGGMAGKSLAADKEA